jgi:hypothetical protein
LIQAIAFCRSLALLSQRGDRSKTCALRAAKNSINDLALNHAAEKWDVLRRLQQIHQPAAGAEKLHRGLAGRHSRTVGRRVSYLNLLAAQKLTDRGHLQLERQRQAWRFFTSLDHPAHHG